MVVETIILACSWHPGHEDDYNGFNPGLILSAKTELTEGIRPYVTVGAYLDSYANLASLAGVGCDFGRSAGFGITIAHVRGSDMEQYPVVPIPSVFWTEGNHGVRLICAPDATAFALGYTYTITP